MSPAVWPVLAFLLGVLIGALATVAAYSSRVAVLETKAGTLERSLADRGSAIDREFGWLRGELAQLREDLNGLGRAIRSARITPTMLTDGGSR